MKTIRKFDQFLNEDTEKKMEFTHKNSDFILSHIHTNLWRVIDNKTRTWSIVPGSDINAALKKAKSLIDDVFADGRPEFYPKTRAKFVVTGLTYNNEGETKKLDSLSFRIGAHSRNPGGTAIVLVKKGEVLIFDRQGEDNGFWYKEGN